MQPFIQGRVVKVDPRSYYLFLESGERVSYDVVSFNTGSEVPAESLATVLNENVFPVKPVMNLFKARRAILEVIRGNGSLRIVVVGGGPAGVESQPISGGFSTKTIGKGRSPLSQGKGFWGMPLIRFGVLPWRLSPEGASRSSKEAT